MAATPVVTVLEHCRVTPPSDGATVELSLPLTFYDTVWWNYLPLRDLFVYKFPRSKTHFVNIVIPKIKESLSIALKHFLPLAGNLIYPSNSSKPEFQYVVGDTLSLTFAETTENFDHLVQKGARNANRFYPLVPQLPQASVVSGMTRTPLFAIQVTLFPNSGICIGWNIQHIIGDGRTISNFFKAWASICKLGGDDQLLASGCLPVFDRAVIEDPLRLDTKIFNILKVHRSEEISRAIMLPRNNVRATFKLSQDDIQKLKNFVLEKRPNHVHVTSFVVTCAYIWACRSKSLDATGMKMDENQIEKFNILVDCRARFHPPIPETYFGNCVVPCAVTLTHGKLAGPEGLLIAAELIGEATRKWVRDKVKILNGSWLHELEQPVCPDEWSFGVIGSPKHDIYSVDFGWGKPESYEALASDVIGMMSLSQARELEGGLEVRLSMPLNRMDAFAIAFNSGLRIKFHKSKI